MRIMASLIRSAWAPWMGMLIAIRSPAPRTAGLLERNSGM